ncbi:urease accessory protein UreD [Mycolicibacterium canariasense]|uniref:Urease accessory protein UreD n=1 Tax=Mycolicibacterium canariasense TaxID=228230 RepID=A0A100WAR2_MYCCR|nr:urease accessory protein UreD [Mycolicibacterium canariasense]MCV7208611.1 urease accessory protein UreD [Mycolicibacterium canariasense]ORV07299.1 hypothetical protein AWB94_15070 [Mycolicibacterium canariasense]GAS94603.1 urease accessory protein UreD [Mycolicibacterium canariasense]
MTAALDLAFASVGGRTVLTRRRYRWPLLVGRVFDDARRPGGGVLTVQNAAGTVIPGDVVHQHFSVSDGAVVTVRGQGATLVSGTPGGAEAVEEVTVTAEAGGEVMFVPAPRILTPRARYRQHLRVERTPGGRVVLVDAVVLHPDCGAGNFGAYNSVVEIRDDVGELLAFDAQSIDAMPRVPRAPTAFGTVYVLGASPTGLEAVVARLPAYGALTELPNGTGWAVRMAAPDGGVLRAGLAAVLESLVPVLS